jgi:methyl-accepting chemotaxis protein
MRFIFEPGARFLLRLPNEKKLPLISLLFLTPAAILAYDVGLAASTVALTWAAVAALVALYAMAAFYVQADMGWRILIASMERISQGDLTTKIDAKLGGHFGIVIRMLEQINASLGGIVMQVRASAQKVATSAAEIAESSSDLSQRTERQASTLEQTAASMEEFSATVAQNARHCELASEKAHAADRVAHDGAKVVHGVVEAMGGIDAGSRRIAEIVGVIEGIAFQTNILALNAAVEAARAGEQGRGFAVVASEVRALAHRSAEAAKEVRSLIALSVEQVRNGSRQAEEAGGAIDAVVASVQQGNALVAQIASASREQGTGVREINNALAQLESVTQQNAAMVQDAVAKSAAFQAEAARLMAIVARFKVASGNDAAPVVVEAGPPRAPGRRPALRAITR